MSNQVFEEKGGPHRGHAAGDTDLEKQASQLASDTKYKVKQRMGASISRMSPAAVTKAYIAQLMKSPAPGAVKTLAQKKLLGGGLKEEYGIDELVSSTVANAMYKVFVDGVKPVEEPQLSEENDSEERFLIVVTDKKTGNEYRRKATRAKIAELRANPNIARVEITQYGKPYEKEAEAGEQTAKVKSGKGLDPVGKEDSKGDVDNDGIPASRDKNDQYLLKRRKAVGNAIATRKEEFDFFEQKKATKDQNTNEIVSNEEKGVNNKSIIKVFPEQGVKESAHQKFLNLLQEKSESEQQQKLFGLALSVKRGETPRSEVSAEVLKIVDTMSEKKIREFAKTSHKGLPKKKVQKEEKECGPKVEDEVENPQQMKTKINLAKNKLRSMGLKMSYEPEGEQIDEMLPALAAGAALLAAPAVVKAVFDKPVKKALDNATNDPNRRLVTGGTVGQLNQAKKAAGMREAREPDEGYGESDNNPQVKAHNRSVAPKYRPRPRRPRMEDDPRYGTPRDRSGKWKY